jgi:hypothetical protein
MELEPKRAKRRRLTATVARRRHSSYVHINLCGNLERSRKASLSPHFWAKKGIAGCSCHKAHHGAPRQVKGICDQGNRHRIYRWRALTKKLQALVRCEGIDLQGDEVAVLSHDGYAENLWW